MSGPKRPASFGSSQLVKRARPDGNGSQVAITNGGSNALIQGVSLPMPDACMRYARLKLRLQGRNG